VRHYLRDDLADNYGLEAVEFETPQLPLSRPERVGEKCVFAASSMSLKFLMNKISGTPCRVLKQLKMTGSTNALYLPSMGNPRRIPYEQRNRRWSIYDDKRF